jgi:hypothetical protein
MVGTCGDDEADHHRNHRPDENAARIRHRTLNAPTSHEPAMRAAIVDARKQVHQFLGSGQSPRRSSRPCEHTAMRAGRLPDVEVIDLAPGLWIWRIEHPGWTEDADWQQVVTCVCAEAGGERWLLDPLLPPEETAQVWDRLAERPPRPWRSCLRITCARRGLIARHGAWTRRSGVTDVEHSVPARGIRKWGRPKPGVRSETPRAACR